MDDHALAAWLAEVAGDALLVLREESGFDDPATLKAAGDKRSHDVLMTELRRARPADAVLSEEGARQDPARLSADRVWIVDPLDGTREFSEAGRDDWAVHIALWQRSTQGLVAGAVAMPARGLVLRADQPPPLPADREGQIRLACSRTRPPAFLADLADALGACLVPMGSAGVKACAVVTGEVDAYVHAGGQYEWDSAAPVAIAQAVGVHTSRVDGRPLTYNQADPLLPDLLVCRSAVAARILDALRVLI
ncbi:MAG TPA: 3'(2'),5'-bisphosphate nucleotidase CysQ [Micromonosporaceae bacterium]|nr:3'(2'),5'-bisphosphate nucleotidase CysQ [Micromonosporaceae bacterium]